eukprot:2661813-Karenia_brevis.AAC.1
MTDAKRSTSKVAALHNGTVLEKKQAWQMILDAGFWRPEEIRWGRRVSYYFPVLCKPEDVAKLYPDKDHLSVSIDTTFPAVFDVLALAEYMTNEARKANLK